MTDSFINRDLRARVYCVCTCMWPVSVYFFITSSISAQFIMYHVELVTCCILDEYDYIAVGNINIHTYMRLIYV